MVVTKEALATIEELAACSKVLAQVDRRLAREDLTSEEVRIIIRKAKDIMGKGREECRFFYDTTIAFWDEPLIDPDYEVSFNNWFAARATHQQQGA